MAEIEDPPDLHQELESATESAIVAHSRVTLIDIKTNLQDVLASLKPSVGRLAMKDKDDVTVPSP